MPLSGDTGTETKTRHKMSASICTNGLDLAFCMYGCFSTQIAFRRLSVPLGNMGAKNEHMKAERILRELMDWAVRSVFF